MTFDNFIVSQFDFFRNTVLRANLKKSHCFKIVYNLSIYNFEHLCYNLIKEETNGDRNAMNNINTVCFTGHRSIDYNVSVQIPKALKRCLTDLIERGAVRFRTGGAMGFDTIAALCVLELKEIYPHITLELKLPCRDQTRNWDSRSVTVYNYILKRADSVEYVSESFTASCMHERNRRLVDGSDVCVAFLNKSSGGSAYTFGYALERGLEVININDVLKNKN